MEGLARVERRLFKKLGACIREFELIEEGDRILVAVSGGKDSYTLLKLLHELRSRAPVRYELVAAHVDLGDPAFPVDLIEGHFQSLGVEYAIHRDRIVPIVKQKIEAGKSPCFLCARMRRGALYGMAPRLGCNKIALGHHLDDLLETLLMNLFHSGQLKSMPPRLWADDGRNQVIRPMAFIEEQDIIEYASYQSYPIVSCSACAIPEAQRAETKQLITALAARHPMLRKHMLAALKNVRPTHLLDRKLFDPRSGPGSDLR